MALAVFAAALVGTVSLTAGVVVGSLIHPGEVTFEDRWPQPNLAVSNSEMSRTVIDRYRS